LCFSFSSSRGQIMVRFFSPDFCFLSFFFSSPAVAAWLVSPINSLFPRPFSVFLPHFIVIFASLSSRFGPNDLFRPFLSAFDFLMLLSWSREPFYRDVPPISLTSFPPPLLRHAAHLFPLWPVSGRVFSRQFPARCSTPHRWTSPAGSCLLFLISD